MVFLRVKIQRKTETHDKRGKAACWGNDVVSGKPFYVGNGIETIFWRTKLTIVILLFLVSIFIKNSCLHAVSTLPRPFPFWLIFLRASSGGE
jgi:hypothetical protein